MNIRGYALKDTVQFIEMYHVIVQLSVSTSEKNINRPAYIQPHLKKNNHKHITI